MIIAFLHVAICQIDKKINSRLFIFLHAMDLNNRHIQIMGTQRAPGWSRGLKSGSGERMQPRVRDSASPTFFHLSNLCTRLWEKLFRITLFVRQFDNFCQRTIPLCIRTPHPIPVMHWDSSVSMYPLERCLFNRSTM